MIGLRAKYLLAVLSGLLITASFPPGDFDWLAWFGLVPLLIALEGGSPSLAFKLGLSTGLAHYLTLIYWLIVALKHYGNIPLAASLALLLMLCAYLALYPACFAVVLSYIRKSRFYLLKTAGLWVALEYVRAKILTGFPWCLLGYTQYRHPELLQIADLAGVYAVSFVLVLANALICALLLNRRFRKNRAFKWDIAVIFLIALFTAGYSLQRMSTGKEDQKKTTVAVVQGNIDQSTKWNPAFQKKTIQTYRDLTRRASEYNPDVVVWPETAVPFFFQDHLEMAYDVIQAAREARADLVFGSPAYRQEDGQTVYYNRAYHLSPHGRVSGYYDKVHLVPFGEYVPLKHLLPFVHRLVVSAGDFSPGEKLEPLTLSNLSSGILICFEIIFPEVARAQVKNGAQVLVNLTNDAWYGRTSAPYQHFSMAVFRAAENARPLIRAANTGFSGFIDKRGRIMEQGALFSQEVLAREVVSGAPQRLTVYTRFGDVFALGLLVGSALNLIGVLFGHRKSAGMRGRAHRSKDV
jgi:apolipoprotein N-acyltransferase